eukprot:CAMPEP_0177660212 /NCGR_PEP_ID=MMETSP0447-20121125/17899_1 /TAXON_ID=0 /ORGANISM="Stygamoeba regulata, Strain BSH-02190019" /LENGTH=499 /DNA_ID=CAMNT_0019165221 /DNA_START=63 /DNA_END=1562 /DNA_ORIENTATION=+
MQLVVRVVKRVGNLRSRLTSRALVHVVSTLPTTLPQRAKLLECLNKIPDPLVEEPEAMEVDKPAEPVPASDKSTGENKAGEKAGEKAGQDGKDGDKKDCKPEEKEVLEKLEPIPPAAANPNMCTESQLWLQLLGLIYLIDKKSNEEASALSDLIVEQQQGIKSQTVLPLSWKIYFYFFRAHELCGTSSRVRGTLHHALRTASLRQDHEGVVTVLNLLLRYYVSNSLFDQADKLMSKTIFKESAVSSNQDARFWYYKGVIKSIQLEYTEADNALTIASRKAPQTGVFGFRQQLNKIQCVVKLLMGTIPERNIFIQRGLQQALHPYFLLSQSVRIGNVTMFTDVVHNHRETFMRDKTLTLIKRLHHNVIKAGLRKITQAYSRISLADICTKLAIDSEEDAEFIVAKAIRDGVVDAIIDHEGRFMKSQENPNVYNTEGPMDQYSSRIEFCLRIHDEAVTAMRFPDTTKGKEEREKEWEREREREKEEQAIRKELEEEDQDDL